LAQSDHIKRLRLHMHQISKYCLKVKTFNMIVVIFTLTDNVNTFLKFWISPDQIGIILKIRLLWLKFGWCHHFQKIAFKINFKHLSTKDSYNIWYGLIWRKDQASDKVCGVGGCAQFIFQPWLLMYIKTCSNDHLPTTTIIFWSYFQGRSKAVAREAVAYGAGL